MCSLPEEKNKEAWRSPDHNIRKYIFSRLGGESTKEGGTIGFTEKQNGKWIPALLVLALLSAVLLCSANPVHASEHYDTTVLAVANEEGETVAWVTTKIADRPLLRYLGLSGTDRLDTGTGMWFVFQNPDTRAFVMRRMNYPLDIIFVDETHRIRVIHSAAVEDTRPLTRYQGWGQYVLEVPMGWAKRYQIHRGYRVRACETCRTRELIYGD